MPVGIREVSPVGVAVMEMVVVAAKMVTDAGSGDGDVLVGNLYHEEEARCHTAAPDHRGAAGRMCCGSSNISSKGSNNSMETRIQQLQQHEDGRSTPKVNDVPLDAWHQSAEVRQQQLEIP